MSDSCQHSNPLIHQGTSQSGRILDTLDPGNVKLHDLDTNDWLQFACEYARLVNFYPQDNAEEPSGDWQKFFETKGEAESLLERYEDGDVEPHLALFVSFLKLLAYPRDSINQLPRRHLDFYYKEVLKLKKQPYTPDRLHILFELAQNAQQELIDTGVLLKAGKDSEGKPLSYKTTTPLVVNSASVASLKSVYIDEGIVRRAPVVNSADGEGEELEDGQSWPAFGQVKEKEEDESVWPEAELSFYIASPLLFMKEGARNIHLKFNLSDELDIPTSRIQAFVTGEKEWIPASSISLAADSDFNFILEIAINAEAEAVLPYNDENHASGLDVGEPVLKIAFTESSDYQKLKNCQVNQLQLEIDVQGVGSLQLQNELGGLDPSKPFMPFGSRPKVGSKLSIVYPEMYNKPISNFKLSMRWLNLPANFSEYYNQYRDAINNQKESYNFVGIVNNQINYNALIFYNSNWPTDEIPQIELVNGSEGPPEDNMRENFMVEVTSPFESGSDPFPLFTNPPQVQVEVGGTSTVEKGEIKLALTESFYHNLYQEIYVNAVLNPVEVVDDSGVVTGKKVDLPNEPYTPLLDQLTLNYTARENISFAAGVDTDESSVMFHRHPFGTKRVVNDDKTLLPAYNRGTLYVGLEEMQPGSNISLLFQVAEGSENPLHSNFTEGGTDITWAVLSNNDWKDLEDHVVRNETNHFLRSGIMEIAIPNKATNDNSLMSSGLHWLRIQLKKERDAVCRFTGVHAQAATAVFDNQENTTDHLEIGLPAESISKLVNPRAKIKSVVQPYDSFGGRPTETDDAFYRRVSERLRHKNRAVSIWDYEHLVLQQFPSLYKVKCLNHAYWNSSVLDELSPGNVTLVLIPKLTEENIEHRMKPRVSQDFKDRVEEYVNEHNSLHADIRAANAVYEPVRFEFDIRFEEGLDSNFYEKQTKEDLKRLIAPWVFESEEGIRFGGMFTEYEIVNYLENLEYVDYIENFNMFHKSLESEGFTRETEIKPSNPMAILVPAQNHTINPATACT